MQVRCLVDFSTAMCYYCICPAEDIKAALSLELQKLRQRFGGNMKIIQFENKYRDDLIFMILEAKNALGRVPGLNEDLLDIKKNYFDKGDMFWIAVDSNDRVIGSVGYSSVENSTEIWLRRLFVKYNLKHNGIGTQLLHTAEEHARSVGKTAINIHLGDPEQFYESHKFYPKHGYCECEYCYMKKYL